MVTKIVYDKCRHCPSRNVNRPRGLCWQCYEDKSIRCQYPSLSKCARRGIRSDSGQLQCWSCPARINPAHARKRGWKTRDVQPQATDISTFLKQVKECYCPSCFALYGWPEPIEQRYIFNRPNPGGRNVTRQQPGKYRRKRRPPNTDAMGNPVGPLATAQYQHNVG